MTKQYYADPLVPVKKLSIIDLYRIALRLTFRCDNFDDCKQELDQEIDCDYEQIDSLDSIIMDYVTDTNKEQKFFVLSNQENAILCSSCYLALVEKEKAEKAVIALPASKNFELISEILGV